MPIPPYEEIMLPALRLLADGKAWPLREFYAQLAPTLHVTEEEQTELLPSGTQSRWHNRANWACYDLYRAGLFSRPRRGVYQITDAGKQVLAKALPRLDRDYLRQFPAFRDWVTASERAPGISAPPIAGETESNQTANERLDQAFQEIHRALKLELIDQVRAMSPFAFEQLVVDVLVAMGYGGSRAEAARVTQRSGDEGIDGIINEDRLGLDVVYIQAKRWQQTVGRRELQAFVGALAGQRATKGVFITSGEFAQTARDFVQSIQQKVVLIDGERLAELMVEHGVGVSEVKTYVLKRLDSDYFETE